MKTIQAHQWALVAILATLTLSLNASAEGFREDFDGPTDDGIPVTWTPGSSVWGSFPGGQRDVVDGSWVWTLDAPDEHMSAYVEEFTYEDVSLHMQYRLSANSGSINIAVCDGEYSVRMNQGGAISLSSFGDGWLFRGQSTGVDPVNHDVHMQVDKFQDELSVAVWKEGDPTPATPQKTVEINSMCTGRVGLTFNRWSDATPTVEFRFFETKPLAPLQAGDADQNYDFNQLDLVQVLAAAKYLTGQPATWGEGDWNGAPHGYAGRPPVGDGVFDQIDIVAALGSALYLTGPQAAVQPEGRRADDQASVVYSAATGELAVDAPVGTELTSISIDSVSGIFTGRSATNLGGSFDNDSDTNVFKATFGSSFGSLSFGNVAHPGLDKEFLLGDLTIVGSLQGGGGLGDVDLVYIPVPEPSALVLVAFGLLGIWAASRRRFWSWLNRE